jgi:hypothetical protein
VDFLTKVMTFLIICCFTEIGLLYADTTTALSQKLVLIDSNRDGGLPRMIELEQECLGLLSEVKSAEDSALIYAEAAFVNARNGIKKPEKLISFCKLALNYPLPDTITIQLYSAWAGALHMQYGDELLRVNKPEQRIEIAKICIQGLRQIEIHKLPKSRQSGPSVFMFDYGGSHDDSAYKEIVREHDEALALRRKIDKQNKLILYRDIFIDNLAYLISLDSGIKSEIEQLTRSILTDPNDIKEVILLVDRKLSYYNQFVR